MRMRLEMPRQIEVMAAFTRIRKIAWSVKLPLKDQKSSTKPAIQRDWIRMRPARNTTLLIR